MAKIAEWLVYWLTVGPLKKYRTKILAVVAALLTLGKASGWLDQLIDDKTYQTVFGIVTSAGLITASLHGRPKTPAPPFPNLRSLR